VADLLARCLSKGPADRPQSARELLPILDTAPSGGLGALSLAPPRNPEARSGRSVRSWALVVIVSAVAAIGVYRATRAARAAAPITVAVLPFGDIGGDTAIGLVGDGLADEVASLLARVPGILIKSRSGARCISWSNGAGRDRGGARLKADYLLTAVVRQDHGRWILSADFARAADASSLWDSTFRVSPNDGPPSPTRSSEV
jgi:TolB-like protein